MYNYFKENRVKVLVIPLILYWIILFIGTSIPADHITIAVELSDKLKHFGAYLVLSFLLSLNLHFQEKWLKVSIFYFIFAFIISIFYGVLDELHQLFIPNRSAELLDWIADTLGSVIGVLVSYVFIKIISNKKHKLETK